MSRERPVQAPSSSLFGATGTFFSFFEKISYFLSGQNLFFGIWGMNEQYSWQILAFVSFIQLIKFRCHFKAKNIIILQCGPVLIFEGPVPSRKLQAPDFLDQPGNQRDISYQGKSQLGENVYLDIFLTKRSTETQSKNTKVVILECFVTENSQSQASTGVDRVSGVPSPTNNP